MVYTQNNVDNIPYSTLDNNYRQHLASVDGSLENDSLSKSNKVFKLIDANLD